MLPIKSNLALLSPASPATKKSQNGVQSLEIGLSIFDVLVNHNEPMMLKDIAETVQMHPAKIHRYLVSLIRKEYVQKIDDGRYALGIRVNDLKLTQINEDSIIERLIDAATEIKNTLNCSVQISKWFSEGPIVIYLFEPDNSIRIITRIGSRMPLTSSATGRLFISYNSHKDVQPLILAEWHNALKVNHNKSSYLGRRTQIGEIAHSVSKLDQSLLDAKWHQLEQIQERIRKQGYATVNGDMLAGINAISLPVLLASHDNKATASMSFDASTASPNVSLEYAITVISTSEHFPTNKSHLVVDSISKIVKQYGVD